MRTLTKFTFNLLSLAPKARITQVRQLLQAPRWSFCEFQKTDDNIQQIQELKRRLHKIDDIKMKEKYFDKEILAKLHQNVDPLQLDIILLYLTNSKWNCGKITVARLINKLRETYVLNDLETIRILQLIQSKESPEDLRELVEVIECYKFLSRNELKLVNDKFVSEFRQALQRQKGDFEISELVTWNEVLTNLNSQDVDLNGVINSKAKEDLYDYSCKEWTDILRAQKSEGIVELELLKEMDKILGIDLDVFEETILLEKYLTICVNKDYKPTKLIELEQMVIQQSVRENRLVAAKYIDNVQYVRIEFINQLKTELKEKSKILDADVKQLIIHNQIKNSGQISMRKQLLKKLGFIKDRYQELQEKCAIKDVQFVLDYFLHKRSNIDKLGGKGSDKKQLDFTLEELFIASKFIQQTDMFKRNSDFNRLAIPNIITPQEQLLVQKVIKELNQFFDDQKHKKVSTTEQFLKVNCLSAFMGFQKQAKDVMQQTISEFTRSFENVYQLPLIAEYGTMNPQIAIEILPIYSNYIQNKYILRNQLTLDEALILMKNLSSLKSIYTQENSKYQNKEFVYAVKIATRLTTDSFLRRLYTDFNDAKTNKKKPNNPFIEKESNKWQKSDESEVAEISSDLNNKEIDQLLELASMVNEMNVGSKEFYDAVEAFIVKYYEQLTQQQKSISAYLLSTLSTSNQEFEKIVETSIEKSQHLSLEESVQFLSYLTARYSLNEEIWNKLIASIKQNESNISQLPLHLKHNLYLSKECLNLEQPTINFSFNQSTQELLVRAFQIKNQEEMAFDSKFCEAIKYFLERLGYYYEANERVSIFQFRFSQSQSKSLILILDKWSFIGDTKVQRTGISVMIRMLNKLDYKLKIMNVYDWAGKEKRHEKVSYLRSKVKGMAFDAEKQKKKTYFNF